MAALRGPVHRAPGWGQTLGHDTSQSQHRLCRLETRGGHAGSAPRGLAIPSGPDFHRPTCALGRRIKGVSKNEEL